MKFYAAIEVWSSVVSEIKKTVRGKSRSLGVRSKVQVKKNRITGRNRSVSLPISHSYGVDDIKSCVDFLIEEKHWKGNKTGTRVVAPEFDYSGSVQGLVTKVEDENLEQDLRGITEEVWIDIEDACQSTRKKRYE